ncbi:MAG: hypothetical protein HUU46_18120 [Candidatus Hydrogenedentes bacterium]|nr:hypothetical protein [Candidatus Hydrogenedentota bacterium]
MRYVRFGLVCIACAMAVSCATQAKNKAEPAGPVEEPAKAGKLPPLNPNEVYRPGEPAEKPAGKPAKSKNVRVTIGPEAATLGDVIRSMGTQTGGNIVLMNGVESRVVRDLQIKRRPIRDAATTVAAHGGLAMEEHPQYYFLFPEGYEQLLNVTLSGRLDERYRDMKTDAVFGSGLPLCSVFMWMGYALRVSIVADNSIGDARCGELALAQAPLETAIEAILKSARVAAVQAESTPEFIFLSTPANTNPASALLDEASLGDKHRAVLDRKVTLALPYPLRTGQRMELPLNPSRLVDVLPALTEQLGVRVVAEKGLEQFPVNPCYLREVSVKTAMDLLIRQWLEPNYGYQVLDDRIVVRSR